MREILFRGKSERTEDWVYGGIVHQTDHYGEAVDDYYIIDGTDTQDYDIGYEVKVIPETVGQYTGFSDKNGTKIFEDDILCEPDVMHNDKIQIPGEIARVAMDEGCYFVLYEGYAQFLSNVCNKWDVIGNIHDNPELIGGMDDG